MDENNIKYVAIESVFLAHDIAIKLNESMTRFS